ncbi:MAG: DUF1330 domain-containing protein [Rhizobiales bacterium]|nr:DUF1330 domain-containing protein [Hyphomicrobiales bacterium]
MTAPEPVSKTFTSFSKEIYEAFKANDREGPVLMMNLIRLRPNADYVDGRDATGREAYGRYSELSASVFARLGGRIVWRGDLELTVVGPSDERWDIAFIAEYPSPNTFVQMMRDPQYREAMKHRQAGVADSRLLRFAALPAGTTFSGQ